MTKQLLLLVKNFGQPKTFRPVDNLFFFSNFKRYMLSLMTNFQVVNISLSVTVINTHFLTLLDLAFSSIYSFTVHLLQLHQTKIAKITVVACIYMMKYHIR